MFSIEEANNLLNKLSEREVALMKTIIENLNKKN
jgi:hypothetical protein